LCFGKLSVGLVGRLSRRTGRTLHETAHECGVLSVENVVRRLVAGRHGLRLGNSLRGSDGRIREVLGTPRLADPLKKVTHECVICVVERLMLGIQVNPYRLRLGDSPRQSDLHIAEALRVGRLWRGLVDRLDSSALELVLFSFEGLVQGFFVVEHGLHLGKRQSQPAL
jgi:hypothetical protein